MCWMCFWGCRWAPWRESCHLWTMSPVMKGRLRKRMRQWLSVEQTRQGKKVFSIFYHYTLSLSPISVVLWTSTKLCMFPSAPKRVAALGACLGCWRAWWAPRASAVMTWSQCWRRWGTTSSVWYHISLSHCLHSARCESELSAIHSSSLSSCSKECSSRHCLQALWLCSQKTGGESLGHIHQ